MHWIGHQDVNLADRGSIERRPGFASITALEYSALEGPGVERLRIIRIDCQRDGVGLLESRTGAPPTLPRVGASQNLAVMARCIYHCRV